MENGMGDAEGRREKQKGEQKTQTTKIANAFSSREYDVLYYEPVLPGDGGKREKLRETACLPCTLHAPCLACGG
jgi:hypothetical protein